MGGAAWQPTGSAVGRLVLLVALVAGAVGWGTTPVAAVPTEGCSGDEVVLLAPASPHAGEPLFVAAISWYPHDLARFTGPTGPLLAEHQVLGDLHFWQAWMVPEWAGEQAFSFVVTDGADTVIAACASAVALVGDAPATPDGLASVAAGANLPSSDPGGTEASTPTPTS